MEYCKGTKEQIKKWLFNRDDNKEFEIKEYK